MTLLAFERGMAAARPDSIPDTEKVIEMLIKNTSEKAHGEFLRVRKEYLTNG